MTEMIVDKRIKIRWTLQELLDSDFPEPSWIVEKIIPEGEMTLIIGKWGELKSFVVQYMASKIISGQDALGLKTKKAKILILDDENSLWELRRRFRKLKNGIPDANKTNLIIFSKTGVKFNSSRNLVKLKDVLITRENPDIIILDSLVRFFEGNENEAQNMKLVFDMMRELDKHNKKPLTWVILHHVRKTQGKVTLDDARGSGDILAQATSVLVLNRDDKTTFTLSQEKYRNTAEPLGDIHFTVYDRGDDIIFERVGSSPKAYNVKEVAENAILPWLCNQPIGTELTSGEIYDTFESHKHNAKVDALQELKDKGFLDDIGRGKWKIVKHV